MSRIMNTQKAKMFHWNASDLDLTLNRLCSADHLDEPQQNLELSVMIVFGAILQVQMITVDSSDQ